jgi:hypothetical protein
MQIKGLLMTQAGTGTPCKTPRLHFWLLSSLGTQKPLFVSPPFFAFLLRRKWSDAFFYPSGPGF